MTQNNTIARSPDLKRLRDEGFDIKVIGTHLLVRDVPYVTADKVIKRGTLVTPLDLQQDVAVKPQSHVVYFIGEYPCTMQGKQLTNIVIESQTQKLAEGVTINFTFSSKPTHGRGYVDYFEKMTTYIKMLANEAKAIDEGVTANTFPIVLDEDASSPFKYLDTASSRAGIDALTPKLAMENVAIVGLGGTGSYVLDLVAKTHVRNIHLFDDDTFGQHNAFRSPGAPGLEDLKPGLKKVAHYERVYSAMRTGIVPHPYRIDETNVHELQSMQFVFVCIDSGEFKGPMFTALEKANVSFVDVGMGVHERAGGLVGIVRVTTSTPAKREHVRAGGRVSFAPPPPDNDYASNVQVADLNCLNATLAVIKWKKTCGFYHDLTNEHHSTYVLETNKLSREEGRAVEEPQVEESQIEGVHEQQA